MSAILRRIHEVEVQYRNILYLYIGWQINMTDYETPPLQTAIDTEQIRNVQDSEGLVRNTRLRYKININVPVL